LGVKERRKILFFISIILIAISSVFIHELVHVLQMTLDPNIQFKGIECNLLKDMCYTKGVTINNTTTNYNKFLVEIPAYLAQGVYAIFFMFLIGNIIYKKKTDFKQLGKYMVFLSVVFLIIGMSFVLIH